MAARAMITVSLFVSGLQTACGRQKQRRVAFIDVHSDPDETAIGTLGAGGQNVYVRELAQSMADDQWSVDIFTRRSDLKQPLVTFHPSGYRTVRLEAGPIAFVARDHLPKYLNHFAQSFMAFIGNTSRSNTYDVLHTHYWLSAWIGMEVKRCLPGKVALVHTYHSLGSVKYRYMKEHGDPLPGIGQQRLDVERRVLVEGDAIVATSPLEARDIQMSSNGKIKARISIIPCGTNIISASDTRSTKINIPEIISRFNDSTKIILYVGRFEERKGIRQLIFAFERARKLLSRTADLRLLLVGGDPAETEYVRIKRVLQESEIWRFSVLTGRINHDQLADYYSAAHVTVLPSLYEPFGLVAIESMRMGTPVIASAVGGLPYIVDHGLNGLLVPADDVEALSRAIATIVRDEERAKEMGSKARQKVLKVFNWRKVAGRMTDLYDSLIKPISSFVNEEL